MSTFKCKMCGGNLEIIDNSTVCECEYCGTQQTIPSVRDDVTANLFNRANNLRMKNEFDKAQEIYEKIVSNNENESEAYWGIVLCKFGIEYVEDSATFKKIPTCHRTQLESVLTDVDYLAAIEHADLMQKSVYETEAKAIDKLQHDILDIVHKEEPFDVFICYKESDENGKRTQDSVIANDIYHQLTQEGFKVFYAAITLEDKLGQEYEPYIFAALNSAKVMLAIGTKPEYFSAVWVKNEWSRYLKLMKNDRSKMLFPCYKDMDAYDLPEEFSHLQAQDMSKIGFINDLVRGIKKVIVKEEPKAAERVVEKVVETAGNTNTAPLLKRAFMFLEDSEWESADEYAEKVLDIDPECADAYLVKLYGEFKICNREEFRSSEKDVDDLKASSNFKKAYKFGKKAQLDEDINEILYNQAAREEKKAHSEEEYNNVADCFKKLSSYKNSAARAMNCIEKGNECAYQIAEKAFANANDKKSYNRAADLYRHISGYKDADKKAEKAIEAGMECAYQKAEKTFESADTKEEYNRAADMYRNISGYKDADEKAEKAIEAGKECSYQIAEKAFENAYNEESYNNAAELYRHISGYKDAYEKRNICVEKALECNKEDKYNRATNLAKQDTIAGLNQAIIIFTSISEWQDSAERAEKCRQRIEEKEEEKRLRKEKENQARIAAEEKAKSRKKVIAVIIGLIVLILIIVFVVIPAIRTNIANKEKYNNAVSLMEQGSYADAVALFGDLNKYKDSKEKLGNCIEAVRAQLPSDTIAAGSWHTVGLKSDGTVTATGENESGQCNVSDWTNVAAVAANNNNTVLLKSNGTVVAAGDNFFGQCDLSYWTDITAVAVGDYHIVGLKSNGTVVAIGKNESGQCDVSGWTDIVAVSAGISNTIGVKPDGTVVAAGINANGQCDVSDWNMIIDVSAGNMHTVGLKADGTVVATGANDYGQCNVSDWTDIVAVSAGWDHTVGLKADGTVVAAGDNNSGQCNVSDWTDIVAVAAGGAYTVGLKSDGTVITKGATYSGQCNVSDWTDIAVHN